MSMKDIDALLTQVGTVVDSIEEIVTNDDSILSQVATAIQALLAKQGTGEDTTNEVSALQALLSKSQTAQTQLAAQKTALQDALTKATPAA